MMTHKTKGIILRAIKYGETSLVVTAFTELFGIQTYMVNGARTSKKTGSKAAMFQPSSLLDMEVYHYEQKSMQRIKECSWSYLQHYTQSSVVKNSIALFMMELLHKTLKQPEQHTDLFYFCEDALKELDQAPPNVAANFPLFFTLHLSHFFGFRINDIDPELLDSALIFLDLLEGNFTNQPPQHPHYLEMEDALITAELLQIMQPYELDQLKLNHQKRRMLLGRYLDYYALHIQDFGQMKTVAVLQEILS
ncbi:MAG: DNA repair protein RecO [Chitinophagaceae bacterium]|nr:MAG: DNA repair protein RecO [Chitinophagaceae bacterium]